MEHLRFDKRLARSALLVSSHLLFYLQLPDNLNAVTQIPPPRPLQTPTSTFILFHITMSVEVRECGPDSSQGHCRTLITGQSRGINARPLGLHHHRCHANYSHISMEIRQTVEGAQAVVVRGSGENEETPEAEALC